MLGVNRVCSAGLVSSHSIAVPAVCSRAIPRCHVSATVGVPSTSGREAATSVMHLHRGTLVVVNSQAGGASGGPPRAAKKKVKKMVDLNGDVIKDLGNGMFTIKLENGVSVMGHLSGKIRQNRIKIVTGDKVTVELSPFDLTRGRITYRFKPGELAGAAAGAGATGAQQQQQAK